jgi:hypothetical protein
MFKCLGGIINTLIMITIIAVMDKFKKMSTKGITNISVGSMAVKLNKLQLQFHDFNK